MKLAYPTKTTAIQVQGFGHSDPQTYSGTGRHMGVDLASNTGAPIYAACAGVVDVVNFTGAHGYGRHVIIEHGDFRTLYAHLHGVFVVAGQAVEPGQQIGEMGGDPFDDDKVDGASTGSHLHFELILSAEPKIDFVKTIFGWTVDPMRYLLERFAPAPIQIGTVVEKQGVRVRSDPNNATGKNILYAMQNGARFEIAELQYPMGDTWARIRALRTEWVCCKYQKQVLVKLEAVSGEQVADGDASTSASTPPLSANEIRRDELNRLIAMLQARSKELE